MPNGIHKSLLSLAVDIEGLSLMEGNPRIGDVDAIMASYQEFGQVKPIVARRNEDGTATVIAGNHQLQAATNLGWDKIAVVFLDADDKRAIAFAIADNRTMELGYTEPELLDSLLMDVAEYYPELFEELGWDEFELASIENQSLRDSSDLSTSGTYTTPQMIIPQPQEVRAPAFVVGDDGKGGKQIVASPTSDHREIAVRGAGIDGSAPQAVVQYTIVFDNPQQQTTWYDFIKWLRSDPGTDGKTTAERLINFIEAHTEV